MILYLISIALEHQTKKKYLFIVLVNGVQPILFKVTSHASILNALTHSLHTLVDCKVCPNQSSDLKQTYGERT